MTTIFLSYRRSDQDITTLIYKWLIQHGIPKEDVYFDQNPDVNQYGHEFPTSITDAVAEAKLMIVVIGPTWTTAKLPGRFKTRIQEDDDWVRKEIALAIKTNTKLLPVVIDKRPIPTTEELPPELHPLCSIHMAPLYRDLQHFELDMQEIARVIDRTFPGLYPDLLRDLEAPVFEVPDSNLLFTGRNAFLEDLHNRFHKSDNVTRMNVPLAIRGLGGMGKTQAAIEYAYRYRDKYKTVLWAKADTSENLRTYFIRFAGDLNLPEKDNKNPQRAIEAVKNWLRTHSRWLLIFDNADEPEVVQDFLPQPNRGHTLLTTRAMALKGIAERVEIPPMEEDEGVLLLLRRAGILEPTAANILECPAADQGYARAIVRELGGLPLAIQQAGAYIERNGDLSAYLEIYQAHRAELLRQGKPDKDKYGYTVSTTWSLSFHKVQKANPAAIELLRLCAFLDPDAIPEEMVTGGTQALVSGLGPVSSDSYKMNEAVAELLRFSLIHRDSKAKTLTIHRLVQAVIQDDMKADSRRTWAERAIRTVNHAFPNNVDKSETWPRCERYLPHALACAALIKKYGPTSRQRWWWIKKWWTIKNYGLASPEAVRLLNQAGTYLRVQSRFQEAEPLLVQALAIREQISGPDHPDTVVSLDSLARLYFDQYLYRRAEPLYQRALDIRQQNPNSKPEEIAQSLNRLGLNYWYMGYRGKESKERRDEFYEKARELFSRALPISEEMSGPEDQLTLNIRNNQALLYRSQGKYEDAITINKQVLAIRQGKVDRALRDNQKVDSLEQEVAQSLQNLAVTYYQEQSDKVQRDASKYAEAERLLKQALALRKKRYSDKPHVQVARCLHYLALVYMAQNQDEDAEEHFKQALAIWGKLLEDPSEVIEAREEYGALLRKLKRDEEAAVIVSEVKAIKDTASSQE